MDALSDAFEIVSTRHRILEVYTVDDAVASDLQTQFSTRNVDVVHYPFPWIADPGFVVIRTPDGAFRGALGLETLRAILSPKIRPPWEGTSDSEIADIFAFLNDMLFTASERRQLLAVTREIEERAWRIGTGNLYAGFQRASAFEAQIEIYNRFVRETDVDVRIFVDDEIGAVADDVDDDLTLTIDETGEIGQFWFVLFDGGESEVNTCGILATEDEPGRYTGFWTDDPSLVEDLIAYLERTYGRH